MKSSYYPLIAAISALTGGGSVLPVMAQGSVQVDAQIPDENGVDVLTRGPLHEAFASAVSYDPQPGVTVNTAPPSLIEEIPPGQRPAGDNVTWIPGYWGWDEENNDFIWVSGIWRSLPPGRQWVPGYWANLAGKWQWTSGYWADEADDEVVYYPKPPATVEAGPNVEAPSANHVWLPGTWIYREDRYAWSPGYWEPAHENWIWMPAHYVWCPRGYVFINGFWDYDVARRGVVFAPVRFRREIYTRRDYAYRPTTVINSQVFTEHLFVRPNYGNYYFGDYYEPRYQERGFVVSSSYRNGYDPIYAYQRWQHRDDRNWERSRTERIEYFRTHEEARPPRTWADFRKRREDVKDDRRSQYAFAEPLDTYVREGGERHQRFEPVTAEYREKVVTQRQEVSKFTKDRQQLETQKDDRPEADRKQVRREKFEKSPLVGKRADELTGDQAPPTIVRDEKRESRPDKAVQKPDVKTGDEKVNPAKPNTPKESLPKPREVDRPDRAAKAVDPNQTRDRAAGREVPDRRADDSRKERRADPTLPTREPGSSRKVTPEQPDQVTPRAREPKSEKTPNPSSDRRVNPERSGGDARGAPDSSSSGIGEPQSGRRVDPDLPNDQPSSSRRVEPPRESGNPSAERRVAPQRPTQSQAERQAAEPVPSRGKMNPNKKQDADDDR